MCIIVIVPKNIMVFINKKIETKCISFLSIAGLIRIDLQMCLHTPVRKEDKKE